MARLGFGGIPTEMDVRKLIDHFGVVDVGMLIPYEEVSRILGGLPYRSSRFGTIMAAWSRRLWKEHRRFVVRFQGEGMKVLTADERLVRTEGGIRSHIRGLGRDYRHISEIESAELTTDMLRDRREKLAIVAEKTFKEGARQYQPLLPSKVQALPRMKI
jgi:hypothetical protein